MIAVFLGGQGADYLDGPYTAAYLPYTQDGPVYYGVQPAYYISDGPYATYADVYDPYQSGYDPLFFDVARYDSNPILRDMIGNALASGYQQGFIDGQYASNKGWGDRYYNDPYAYDHGSYAMCSVSLAEQRQLLSQGYRLGYNDALNDTQAAYYYDGTENIGIVSLLLDDVLRVGV